MFNHTWVPLTTQAGQRCLMWDYDQSDNRSVVYRFVWTKTPSDDPLCFYVGSGLNLSSNAGQSKSLVYQYKNGQRKQIYRLPMQLELQRVGGAAWTETLVVNDPALHAALQSETKMGEKTLLLVLEDCLIYQAFDEYRIVFAGKGNSIPRFFNDKISNLFELMKYL
jgi:hypothetical protein